MIVLVFAAAGLAIATSLLWQKDHELSGAYASEKLQRARGAEANLGLAREAIDRMWTTVGADLLVNVPQMETVRSEVLHARSNFTSASH